MSFIDSEVFCYGLFLLLLICVLFVTGLTALAMVISHAVL
jgi:hypothetical protein